MRRVILLLSVLPLWVVAQEHRVPVGTQGNSLLFSVKNGSRVALKGIEVVVESAPEWLAFEDLSAHIDSIPGNDERDVEFVFSVQDGEAGRTGDVELHILGSNGSQLAVRSMTFTTELDVKETKLFAPYPNPSNPFSMIRYVLEEPARVKLEVYNVLGQRVRMLADEEKPAGKWSVRWDGRDDRDVVLSSGVYFIRLETTVKGKTRQWNTKILLAK